MVGFDQEPASVALNGDIQDGVDFRRARIGVEGTILEVTNYRIEMDFAASGRPIVHRRLLGVSELPYINNIRAGHYKEWYSLEELTSSNYITFMERRCRSRHSLPHVTGAYQHSTTSRVSAAPGRSVRSVRAQTTSATISATRANGLSPAV